MEISKILISKAQNLSGFSDPEKAVETCLTEFFESVEKKSGSSVSSSETTQNFSKTLNK